MNAKPNDGTQDNISKNFLSNVIQKENNYEKMIIPDVAKIKELKLIEIGAASKNVLQNSNEENIKSKTLESDQTEENKKNPLTNTKLAHEVQVEGKDEGFKTSKNLTIKKTEELKENTVSTNEMAENDTHTNKPSINSWKFLSFKDQTFLVHFKANSVNLDSSYYAMLNKVVETLYMNPNFEIIIEGHTDSYGGHVFNKHLSEYRANMIKSYLIGKGVEYSRITTIGFGSDMPIADNLTIEGRQKNRRVEITIKTKS
jgi:outer membrane protein OmpA-like peptidoglycan-associated protein